MIPNPDNEDASKGAGDLLKMGRVLHRASQFEEAERLYRQALAQEPENAEAHELLAVMAGQRGQFDEAIAGLRRAIELAGPSAQRWYNLAEAYRLADDFRSALAAYTQTIAIDPAHIDAYRDCAEMAKDHAMRVKATGSGEAAERFNKVAAHYLTGLGHALVARSDAAAAEGAYREALALDPDNAASQRNLAILTARPNG